jgi:hypothetical protein
MQSKWEPPSTQKQAASTETPTVQFPAYGGWKSLLLCRRRALGTRVGQSTFAESDGRGKRINDPPQLTARYYGYRLCLSISFA